ncbi:YihY/virulence factor BrkB family protein [Flavobacterium terrigena]|uniref:Membrane protein n=1 Tax=Flavobacterium terrigena TaxID=402734 RepID=A0A1H6QF91_9FLAO|nr:YihY/virulence factor BrkB family protein [Flavobacterium terrigena]SEI42379.1 membrane protein [Flavobacterium terrigena]
MDSQFKDFLKVIKTAFHSWWLKDPFKESAVIAYYAIFSLPGLLAVIISFAGYFFGHEAVSGQITNQITGVMGANTAQQIQDIIIKAMMSRNSVLATIIGIITILVGATGVFVQFQKSLNAIWKVKADASKSGIISYLKARLFSFGFIIAIAFILIASLVVSTVLTALGDWLINYFSESLLVVLLVLNFIISFGILTLLFAFMFKYFPDAQIKWRDVWLGAFVTALLFELGKSAIGLYFGTAQPDSGYGAAGSIILIMLWVSYSSMLVFFGAEFTHCYTELKHRSIKPNEFAKKIN